MHGLAEFLSDEALKTRLEPVMAALDIPSHAFCCEKYRKKRWANVTFLEQSHGQAFLRRHGQQQLPVPSLPHGSANDSVKGPQRPGFKSSARNPGSRRQARLTLAGNEIFCALSKPHTANAVAGQPNPITLRGLKYAAEETVNPTRMIQKEVAPNLFDIETFSCGHNAFDSDKLVFIPEIEFPDDPGTAKFTKSTLLIKLSSGHVIRIANDTIVELICSFDRILTLTLTEVPSFFRETDDLSSLINNLFAAMQLGGPSSRLDATRIRVGSLNDRHSEVVGRCLVYQFQITGADLPRRIGALSRHDSLPFQRFNLITQRTPPPHLGNSRHAMAALMVELTEISQANHLPFGILFQLQALASNAYLHPGTVLELTRKLRRSFKSDRDAGIRPISVGALKMLFKQIDWPTPHGEPSHFKVEPIIALLRHNDEQMLNEAALQQGSLGTSQTMASVHRVTVTPSRITLHGPELEAKNRILRKYRNHHEYFMRVQFCDENGQDLFFNSKISYEEVWSRFKHVLGNGIQIAGRTYSFLGFSHSSLRSHSAWVSNL